MKDEIKEILDDLRFSYEQNNELYEKYNQDVMRYIIHLKEAELLLDYITNLQDTLKDREEYCYGLETQLTNLQEELKSANESITWWTNRFNTVEKRCEYLQRSCDRKEEQRDDARMEYMEQEDYKLRCEKALDKLYCYGEIFDSKILQQFQKEMEIILQGEENDN